MELLYHFFQFFAPFWTATIMQMLQNQHFNSLMQIFSAVNIFSTNISLLSKERHIIFPVSTFPVSMLPFISMLPCIVQQMLTCELWHKKGEWINKYMKQKSNLKSKHKLNQLEWETCSHFKKLAQKFKAKALTAITEILKSYLIFLLF